MMVYSDEITRRIEAHREDMVKTMAEIIAIPAISPKSGGQGEEKRADFLSKLLKSWGIEAKKYSYKDDTSTDRTSVVAKYGTGERTIWIIPHIDTVAVGDIKLWNTDPFKAEVKDGKIYGRGTNDNCQSLVGSLYSLKSLKESRAKLKYNFGLVLAADEELGSKYGVQKLMNEDIFKKGDMIVVPDWNSEKGEMMELGEKGLLWLRITINGKQVHASTPEKGKNAYRYAIHFINKVDERLHSKYTKTDRLFKPEISTFEMTKHEKNVDSVNIIPGVDVSYIDCRILPDYNVNEVLSDVRKIALEKEFSDVKIDIEDVIKEEPVKPTSEDTEVVKLLDGAIYKLRGIKTKKVGIGGSTVALFPRRAGFPVAVWSTGEEVPHQPNEYAKISDMVEDSKVFAHLFV